MPRLARPGRRSEAFGEAAHSPGAVRQPEVLILALESFLSASALSACCTATAASSPGACPRPSLPQRVRDHGEETRERAVAGVLAGSPIPERPAWPPGSYPFVQTRNPRGIRRPRAGAASLRRRQRRATRRLGPALTLALDVLIPRGGAVANEVAELSRGCQLRRCLLVVPLLVAER